MANISKQIPFDKINKIRKATGFTSTQKLLLLTLGSHLGQNEFCWPSILTLHKETALSESTIKENLRLLILHGIVLKLVPEKIGRDSNRYAINFEKLDRPDDTDAIKEWRHEARKLREPRRPAADSQPPSDEEGAAQRLGPRRPAATNRKRREKLIKKKSKSLVDNSKEQKAEEAKQARNDIRKKFRLKRFELDSIQI